MKFKIDNNPIYFFLTPRNDCYHTLFLGCVQEDLIETLLVSEPDHAVIVTSRIGENRFMALFDGPVFLLNRDSENAQAYAGDDRKLELFPSGNGPELKNVPPIIDYPSYWLKGIEPLLEWKFDGNLFHQTNGVWVPATTNTHGYE